MTDVACLGEALPEKWWRDEASLRHERLAHGSLTSAANAHGVKPGTVQKGWQQECGEKLPPGPATQHKERDTPQSPVREQEPGLRVDFVRGRATLVTDPRDVRENPELGDAETLVRERGLDPDEWLVERVKVNEWQGFYKNPKRDIDGVTTYTPEVVTLRQLVATLRRKPPVELIFPAVEVRERAKLKKATAKRAARLIACLGDQQADYHDEALHGAFLRWATDVQPDELGLLGDVADFPTISRHPDRPYWNSDPQRCIDTAYRLLSEYRDALPNARMRKLRGNHDIRLESELLLRAERMFGIAPAANGDEQVPGYSIRRLLHLDALHIELIGREGDKWELGEMELAPTVWARHQPPNLKKHLRLNRDVVAGDTHRQSIRQVTTFNDNDEPVVRTLVEAGCMCRTDGLGYTEHPDWQPGFVTVAIGQDGAPSYDLATWRNGQLTWRGETWKA